MSGRVPMQWCNLAPAVVPAITVGFPRSRAARLYPAGVIPPPAGCDVRTRRLYKLPPARAAGYRLDAALPTPRRVGFQPSAAFPYTLSRNHSLHNSMLRRCDMDIAALVGRHYQTFLLRHVECSRAHVPEKVRCVPRQQCDHRVFACGSSSFAPDYGDFINCERLSGISASCHRTRRLRPRLHGEFELVERPAKAPKPPFKGAVIVG